jgi:hypothetical protein
MASAVARNDVLTSVHDSVEEAEQRREKERDRESEEISQHGSCHSVSAELQQSVTHSVQATRKRQGQPNASILSGQTDHAAHQTAEVHVAIQPPQLRGRWSPTQPSEGSLLLRMCSISCVDNSRWSTHLRITRTPTASHRFGACCDVRSPIPTRANALASLVSRFPPPAANSWPWAGCCRLAPELEVRDGRVRNLLLLDVMARSGVQSLCSQASACVD